jgi:ketosteroid isomerase-like protein
VSRKNIELVTRAIRAATARPEPDWEAINALFHPDHVLIPVMSQLESGEFRGARGYQSFLRTNPQTGQMEQSGDAAMSWDADLEGAVDVGGNKVLAVASGRFRGSASGAEMEARIWVVMTVRGDRIARTENFADPADAIEALGRRA